MRTHLLSSVSLLSFLAGCGGPSSAPAPELAVAPVPFKPLGFERQDTAFRCESFVSSRWGQKSTAHERGVYSVGRKTVTCCRQGNADHIDGANNVTVAADGETLMTIMWWGAFGRNYPDGTPGFGYPFADLKGDPPRLSVDRATKTMRFEKRYRDLAGKTNSFWYALSPMKDSKVKLEWSGDNGTQVWISFGPKYFRDAPVAVGGKPYLHPSASELESRKKDGVSTTVEGRDLRIWPDDSVKGVSLRFDGESCAKGGLCESLVWNDWHKRLDYGAMLRLGPGGKKGRIVIDLGKGEILPTDVPPPVEGLDFWASDATHVPKRASRNILHNPSFEQGMRYWNWGGGGASYTPVTDETIRYWTTTGGYHGAKCLILRDTGYPRSAGPAGPRSVPYPTVNGRTYTLSFWAKSLKGHGFGRVGLASAARGGKWKWYPPEPGYDFKVGREWTRFTKTVTTDGAGIIILIGGGGDTLVDCLQFEAGDKATDFDMEPMEGSLLTARRDNCIPAGESPRARFEVRGRPGEVRLTLRNAFDETLFETNAAVVPPAVLPLNLDTNRLGTGVFVLRADYSCPAAGAAKFTDYYRLAVLRPLENRHATAPFFGSLLPSSAATLTRGPAIADWAMRWGFGGTTWGTTADYNREGGVRLRFERDTRVVSFFREIACEHPGLRDYLGWKEVTPERERLIEQVAYDTVRTNDARYCYWAFGNEEESHSKKMGYAEYAKAQHACYRGVKRARPDAKVMPTCGTSGWNRLRGYEAINAYLEEANKRGFKYDAVAVHPYGNVDGGILGSGDGDEWTQKLLDVLKRHGYPDTTPIIYTEAWNVCETYVPEWEAGPCYDYYGNGKPTYDFGHRERLHAGSLARLYLTGLKYWPRLKSINSWTSRAWLDQELSPIAACAAVNTLGNHLPDVAFAGEVKTYADVLGYVFRRKTDGRGVAALWTRNREVERGRREGPALETVLPPGTRAFDLMGTERTVPETLPNDGSRAKHLIRLSPLPVLLEADDPAALLRALQAATSKDAVTWESLKRADPNADAPRTQAASVPAGRTDWTKVAASPCYTDADVRIAWNWEGLRIRVKKDVLPKDGRLTIAFDCGANGRAHALADEDRLDDDDYRYDFIAPQGLKAGRCTTVRVHEVYHQLADGVNMPRKAEAAEKVSCTFTPAGAGGVYEVLFQQRYLEPLMLRPGFLAGLGISFGEAGPGKPSAWPLFVLKGK